MNTKLRKIRNNAKALSPVVASIILIAVTVAVSVAVAAWMGGMTIGFMSTEEIKITSITFNVETNAITVIANNTGTTAVTMNEVWVNNQRVDSEADVVAYVPDTKTANANAGVVVTITDSTTVTLAYGATYQIKLVSTKGNAYLYTASAPSS